MEAALQDPPAISTCSDDDAFNSDDARVHFGPFKFPERKIAAMVDPLAPPSPDPAPPPSDSAETPSPKDNQEAETPGAEDSDDAERVEELVGGEEEGDYSNGIEDEIPFSADYVDDEPSSALALRISVARSNPSPPPSPTLPTNELEPTSEGQSPEGSDTQVTTDNPTVTSLNEAQASLETPPLSRSPSPSPPKNVDMEVDAVAPSAPSPQPDLINFDSFTLPEITTSNFPSAQTDVVPDSAVSAVDALLLISPSTDSPTQPSQSEASPPREVPTQSSQSEALRSPQPVENAQQMDKKGSTAPESLSGLSRDSHTSPSNELVPPPVTPSQAKPLRRSPRKSVAASTAAVATPRGPSTPRPSLLPRKPKALSEEIAPDSQDEGDNQPAHSLPLQPASTANSPRAKERRRSKSPRIFNREVGSLSPTTTNLLTELIPSFTDTTPLQLAPEPSPEPSKTTATTETIMPTQPTQTFSVFAPPPADAPALPSTPQRPTGGLMRPAGFGTPSPTKFQLQPQADVTATPARRITIEKALETGQISPLKASQLGFAPKTPIPSMPQTPARRVLVTDKSAPSIPPPSAAKQQPSRIGSPVRGRSLEPATAHAVTASSSGASVSSSVASGSTSGSAVPSFARPTASTSAHHTASSPSAGRGSKLPYPLVGTEKPPSTSGSKPDASSSNQPPPISSPVKSSLKQPTSRIPRIGAKPYARPAAATKATTPKLAAPKQAAIPAPAPASSAPAVPKPAVIRKVDISKPGTSRMVGSRSVASSSKVNGKETVSVRPVVPPAGSSSNATAAAATSSIPSAIKRKRSPDKVNSSPIKSRMPSSRQAKPTLARSTAGSRIAASTSASTSATASTPAAPVAAAPRQPRTIRKVVVEVPPPPPMVDPASAAPPAPPQQPEVVPENQSTSATSQPTPAPPLVVGTAPPSIMDAPGSPMVQDTPVTATAQLPPAPPPSLIPTLTHTHTSQPSSIPIPVIHIEPAHEAPPIETLPAQEIPRPSVRRTSRLRQNLPAVDYTIPTEAGTTPRASTSTRRKTSTSAGPRFVFNDAYSEMSATALKQLTLANTTRNQHYLSARLETLVVVKEGLRPESPMVKIKTIAQREEEMKEQRRAERAMRRARRSGESVPGSSDLEMSDDDADGEGEGESELPSWSTQQAHTRGAGEEEDYKTPDRAFKRMKLTENGFEDQDIEEERRVKWDKGLFTTVYLDEVKLGTRKPVKDLNGRKGCLAPKAKALKLDTLGNLGGGEEPLRDLAPQHVTVKKFVYDGEVYVEPAPPVVVEPPALKVTRSRSKKAKS